jgi:hypothetical protein
MLGKEKIDIKPFQLCIAIFHLKLAKMLCLSYYLLCFLFSNIGKQESGTGSAWRVGGQTMYTTCE